MAGDFNEGKKTEVLARLERLRELIEEDAESVVLERAFAEVRRSLDGLTRVGQADGNPPDVAVGGESPPGL